MKPLERAVESGVRAPPHSFTSDCDRPPPTGKPRPSPAARCDAARARNSDLLGRLGDAFRFEDLATEVLDVEGARVVVATPATLYRMKRDTVRAVYRMDAEALRRRFGLAEE